MFLVFVDRMIFFLEGTIPWIRMTEHLWNDTGGCTARIVNNEDRMFLKHFWNMFVLYCAIKENVVGINWNILLNDTHTNHWNLRGLVSLISANPMNFLSKVHKKRILLILNIIPDTIVDVYDQCSHMWPNFFRDMSIFPGTISGT